MWIMMRNKFLILLFGLLLAVGWTSSAQAQLLPGAKAMSTSFDFSAHSKVVKTNHQTAEKAFEDMPDGMTEGSRFYAPRRSSNYTVTADSVHPKSWYEQWYYTYYDGTTTQQSMFTDPATNAYQMMALVKLIYTESVFPGIKFSEASNHDVVYQTIFHGWNINGTNYEDLTITTKNNYTYLREITIMDRDSVEVLERWTAASDGTTLPTGWSTTANLRSTTYTDSADVSYTGCYLNSTNGGTITIPSSLFANTTGGIRIILRYAANQTTTFTVSCNNINSTITAKRRWTVNRLWAAGAITPPDENGYTVLLVKLKDGVNEDISVRADPYTDDSNELRQYFETYIDEIQLLTDGLRVDEGTPNAGTVFAYTGDLNKFYYISKGKMAPLNSIQDEAGDRAPFYSMYEEFAPTSQQNTSGFDDFYEKMKQGTTYNIVHDCQSVNYQQHYFSMAGKKGNTHNRVNSLVLYIPDERGQLVDGSAWRNYEEAHLPTVGMYMIDLYADIAPSDTTDGFYTVTVNWFDNLDVITHVDDIPQTYKLYQIRYNEETGQNDTTLVYTGPLSTWSKDYPVGDPTGYDLHYYVIGVPTAATNPDTFFAKSNTDDVTIPGTTDFIGLQWWRYESDYVTNNGQKQEVNYYRNWLAPHALSTSNQAGISAGNVGTTGRTLTLYRENTPIIDLELITSGNKAYYRIKYRDRATNQQVEPGYNENTGELEDPNNNNN